MFTVFFIIEGQNFFPFSIINKQSECAFYNSFNFAEIDDPAFAANLFGSVTSYDLIKLF